MELRINPAFGMIRFKENDRILDCQNGASLEVLFSTREYEYLHFAIGSEHYELSREHWVGGEITIYAIATMTEWPNHVQHFNGEGNRWGTIYSGEKRYLKQYPHTNQVAKMLIFREKNQTLHGSKPPKIIFAKDDERR